MDALALAGVPGLVDGILAGRVGPEHRAALAIVAALVLSCLLVAPFASEAVRARREPPAG